MHCIRMGDGMLRYGVQVDVANSKSISLKPISQNIFLRIRWSESEKKIR